MEEADKPSDSEKRPPEQSPSPKTITYVIKYSYDTTSPTNRANQSNVFMIKKSSTETSTDGKGIKETLSKER
jgi:hypothetical protein